MQATFNLVTNPFHPARDRVQKKITRKLSISKLVERNGVDLSRPTICYYNGKPLLRKFWDGTRVGDSDVVTFIYLPQGGGQGGSSPLRIVLMIVVIIASIFSGGAAAGGLSAMTGTTVTAATATSLMITAGMMLVNALVPPPAPPDGGDRGTPSPTYTLGAQGNQARIGQPIPVIYGRHIIYPDFAAMPYAEFENNDQFLYQLFCIGQGHYQVHTDKLRIEDSNVADFPEIEYAIYAPGEKVTLFPTNVITAGEVNGQEISDEPAGVGPFVINPPETEIDKIAIDLVFPAGLVKFNDEGKKRGIAIDFSFYAQKIDDYGFNVGGEILLASESVQGKTITAVRRTFKYDIAPGRYKVRVVRTSPDSGSEKVADTAMWGTLRGYLVGGVDTYQDVTILAVKIKAQKSVSQQSARKVNVEVTRKLPIASWDAGSGSYVWSTPVTTRSPAWALADIFRAKYGADAGDQRLDIGQLIALDQTCSTRQDWFDGIFDSAVSLWEAVTSVARAARSRPFIQSGLVHVVRDQLQTLPTALFTARNIVKGSLKITYIMPSEDTADCIDVEYLDSLIWRPRTIRCALPDSLSEKPAAIKAFGITTREQAWREGMYMAASNKYRRKDITFETELEGHIPSLGDLIAVQSDIPEWGQAGEVLSVSGSTFTLSEPMTWADGATHYIMLRRPNGSAYGPVIATKGAGDNIAILDLSGGIDFTVKTGTDMERTFFSFGRSGQVVQLARVTSIRPRRETVQISCINEDTRVHSADETTVPPNSLNWALSAPKLRPVLSDFNIVQTGSGLTPSITLTWTAVPGATRYLIEMSTDGSNWATLGEVSSTSYSFLGDASEDDEPVYLRVAAFGGLLGPWVTKSFTIGQVPPPPDVLVGSINSSGASVYANWTSVGNVDGYVVEIHAAGSLKRTIETTDTRIVYSWELAIADGGPWRTLTIKIKAKKGTRLSTNWYTLDMTNAAPAAPSCTARPGVKSIGIDVSPCADLDYAGTIIWGSVFPGFTPDDTNKVFDGNGYFYMVTDIAEGMYFRAAHYDTYGKTGLNLSSEAYSVPTTVAGIPTVTSLPSGPGEVEGQNAIFLEDIGTEIQGIYGWDGTQWIRVGGLLDGSVTTDKLAPNAVDFTKIALGAVQAQNLAVKKHFLY